MVYNWRKNIWGGWSPCLWAVCTQCWRILLQKQSLLSFSSRSQTTLRLSGMSQIQRRVIVGGAVSVHLTLSLKECVWYLLVRFFSKSPSPCRQRRWRTVRCWDRNCPGARNTQSQAHRSAQWLEFYDNTTPTGIINTPQCPPPPLPRYWYFWDLTVVCTPQNPKPNN